MQIQTSEIYNEKNNNKVISSKGLNARSILRTLSNQDALAPTIFLETFVTGGRSLNAYKRGGFYEFRERFTDDFVSAVFWMKGVDLFNKLGNEFGKRVLKLPTTDFDAGKDALRNPFNNLIHDLGEKTSDKQAVKTMEKKLAAFKFSKIILSTITATLFVGFCLPKINQKITKLIAGKDKAKADKKENKYSDRYNVTLEEFNSVIAKKQTPSFKGISADLMTRVAHKLENNKICKMLTCDTGILTGRVVTARNKDEGKEYFFRDVSSSFFYFASTPLIYKFLQKITNTSKSTSLDSVASKQIHQTVIEKFKNLDINSLKTKEFSEKFLGTLDDSSKELLSSLPFNSDVITLKELSKYINNEKIIEKASQMAELQPEIKGAGKVLTKHQVTDVLKNGYMNTPDFMKKLYKEKFKSDLTNPYKFIPMKKITSFRNNIEKYAESIIESANKNNNGVVDIEFLNKLSKKNFIYSVLFRAVALGVSAFALGFAIPKIQYALTEKRTGKNEAPGLREYNTAKNKNK